MKTYEASCTSYERFTLLHYRFLFYLKADGVIFAFNFSGTFSDIYKIYLFIKLKFLRVFIFYTSATSGTKFAFTSLHRHV